MRCAKKQQDVQKKTIRCTKKEKKTVYWDLINSNVNKREFVETGLLFLYFPNSKTSHGAAWC